jgi:integrase
MTDSSVRPTSGKSTDSQKPRPDFPLSIHKGTRYWCKKIKGHVYYFGNVADDPEGIAAEEQYLTEKDDLEAGREPRGKPAPGQLTVEELCFRFLAHKEQLRDEGRLSPRTYAGYFTACKKLAKVFGRHRAVTDLHPDDFRKLRSKLSKTRGVVGQRNAIQAVRSIFKFAFDDGSIVNPVRYGRGFDKPTKDEVDRAHGVHQAQHGKRMLEAVEIRQLLDGKSITDEGGGETKIAGAMQPIRAMILMAVNCGFGQTDLACLPIRALDLESGWVEFPRPKTAVHRRCPLWPETVAAIREWLPLRPKAKDAADDGLLFLTVRGSRWVKANAKGSPKDAIVQEFNKLLLKLGLKRFRLSFYCLRHTFRTACDEVSDSAAIDRIMGHKDHTMGGRYRERLENADARLRRVTEHVRAWLFPKSPGTAPADEPVTIQRRRKSRPSKPQSVESPDERPRLRIVG